MDLIIMDCLYHINKYKDYTRLIKVFEDQPELVIKDKTAHKLIVDLASGNISKLRGKKPTPEESARKEYLIQRVHAYEFLGFQQYSSDNDTKKIADGEIPLSAVGRTFDWYSKYRGNHPFLSYETIKRYVKQANKEKKQKICIGIVPHIASVYDVEKDNINIIEVKKKAEGTFLDEKIFPEFWEELLRVF